MRSAISQQTTRPIAVESSEALALPIVWRGHASHANEKTHRRLDTGRDRVGLPADADGPVTVAKAQTRTRRIERATIMPDFFERTPRINFEQVLAFLAVPAPEK